MTNVKKMRGEDCFTFDLSGGHAANKRNHEIVVGLEGYEDARYLKIQHIGAVRKLRITIENNGNILLSLT